MRGKFWLINLASVNRRSASLPTANPDGRGSPDQKEYVDSVGLS